MSISENSDAPFGRPGRRGFLSAAAASAAGAALAAAALRPEPAAAATTYTDVEILNFALNLEYLEAEYYLRGVYGAGLSSSMTNGVGTQGSVVSVPPTPYVTFTTPGLQAQFQEIANDEQAHVNFLRGALGSEAVAEPNINIGTAFNVLAVAAGLGSSFDPYASELNFIIGGFIFEDVGVTAYHGAAPLILRKSYLSAAAAILAVEAYHAAEIRTLLLQMAASNNGIYNTISAISNLRANLSQASDDQGLMFNTLPNVVPTDYNSLVFARTFRQVLNVVYGAVNASEGLLLPSGMNGRITK